MPFFDRRLTLLEVAHAIAERQRIAKLTPGECEDELAKLDRAGARLFIKAMTEAQLEALTANSTELKGLSEAELQALVDTADNA